jgi:hypothetical protein
MRNKLFLLITIVVYSSCHKDEDTKIVCAFFPSSQLIENASTANVRIKNETGTDLCQVIVDPLGTLSDFPKSSAKYYGSITNNSYSNYTSYNTIYRYSWINAFSVSENYYAKFIDYTGEVPLDSGKYTYILVLTADKKSISINVEKD